MQVISLVKISGTANSVVIGWNVRPTDTARVLGYRIHVSPMDQYGARAQTFTVDRTTLQYQIDNLTPNTRYNITVDATTDGRYYHAGTSTEVKTESTPLKGLLTAPRVIDEQPTSVTLTWDALPGEIAGFAIEFRLSDGAWQQFRQRVPAHPGKRAYTQIVDQVLCSCRSCNHNKCISIKWDFSIKKLLSFNKSYFHLDSAKFAAAKGELFAENLSLNPVFIT